MQNFQQKRLFGLIFVGLLLLGVTVYSNPVLSGIKIFILYNLIPLDLVFDEGIDLSKYDGGLLINCLHGGSCPEGVHYKNDETGKIENRTVVAPTYQPVAPTPPPDPNSIPANQPIPVSVQQQVAKLDNISYMIFIIIIAGLIIGLIVILRIRNRKK